MEKLNLLFLNLENILEQLNQPYKDYILKELIRLRNYGIVKIKQQRERVYEKSRKN